MTLQVKPQQQRRNEVMSAFRILAARAEVKPGCTKCRVARDKRKAGVLRYEENWSCWADLERHISSDAYLRVLQLMETSVSTPILRFEGPDKTCGMELVKCLREKRNDDQGA